MDTVKALMTALLECEDLNSLVVVIDLDDPNLEHIEIKDVVDCGHGVEIHIQTDLESMLVSRYEAGVAAAIEANAGLLEDYAQTLAWLVGRCKKELTGCSLIAHAQEVVAQTQAIQYMNGSREGLEIATERYDRALRLGIDNARVEIYNEFKEDLERARTDIEFMTQKQAGVHDLLATTCFKHSIEGERSDLEWLEALIDVFKDDAAAIDRSLEDEMHRGYDDGFRAGQTAIVEKIRTLLGPA